MEKNGWNYKLTLVTQGPNEGPKTITLEQVDTSAEHAKQVQNGLAQLGIQLNEGK